MYSSLWDNLSLAQLEAKPGFSTKGGQEWRTTCPFHAGSNPTAFSVSLVSGKFFCFACGAKGVLLDFRYGPISVGLISNSLNNLQDKSAKADFSSKGFNSGKNFKTREENQFWQRRNQYLWQNSQNSLIEGEGYLNSRGISLATARRLGLGYCRDWRFIDWRNPGASCYSPALLFPTEGPQGFVNLYVRAANPNQRLHFIPRGHKGIFNFGALARATQEQPLILTEGCFDALAMIEAGYANAAALVGLSLGHLDWFREVGHIILALDNDAAGQAAQVREAKRLKRPGFTPKILPQHIWGSHKDFSSFWQASVGHWQINWEVVIALSQAVT